MKNHVHKIIAIVPARSGSKGLPGKNIANCGGKPLITWTIEAALASASIQRVLVSTDSQMIADVAIKAGAEVPWLRSPELSDDSTRMNDVVSDVLKRLEESFDYVLLLQPTSPLRDANHINNALSCFFESHQDAEETLISVYEAPPKNRWVMDKSKDGFVFFPMLGKEEGHRRQELEPCYFPNGAIYLAPAKNFKGFYGEKTRAFLMDLDSSTDVDSKEDLDLASTILTKRHG